jgi:hypothetical protein
MEACSGGTAACVPSRTNSIRYIPKIPDPPPEHHYSTKSLGITVQLLKINAAQTTPCAIMASATLTNPAMFAP